ncbi:MAG TPA: hypothetical protein VJ323_03080, partial [Bryobacteraceae bacterium]|nr:hypothetical protein [Bryobacteraceae bacterium]
LKAGVEFLVSKKQGPAEAQRALSTYLDGTDMTMAQQAMVDQVIAEYGLPPDPGSVGATLPPPTVPKPPAPKPAPVVQAPARNQGPLPRTHIVKSTNEDSAGELAFLYYGASSAPNINLIVQANAGKAQWNVGEGVKIPARPASLTPTVHRVRTTYEDSPGEIANMYYGRTDAFAISVITKANGNRNKFLVGDLVNVPKFPTPAK